MYSLGNNTHLSIKNVTINYSDTGSTDAKVIIFIHGFPFNKSMWDMQISALKGHCRVIAYDIRGHGDSSMGNEKFSIELFVKDLINFMDALAIDKATLCGLSMGGYIALNAVENHPERFERLILCDTQCVADTPEGKEKRLGIIEKIKKDGVEKYADETVKNLFAPESFTTKITEIAAIKEMILKTTPASLTYSLMALAERKETCSKLSDIQIPTLIIVGKEDILTPPDKAQFLHEKIKNSSICILEHAGHLSNMENPLEFNNQLLQFLEVSHKK